MTHNAQVHCYAPHLGILELKPFLQVTPQPRVSSFGFHSVLLRGGSVGRLVLEADFGTSVFSSATCSIRAFLNMMCFKSEPKGLLAPLQGRFFAQQGISKDETMLQVSMARFENT